MTSTTDFDPAILPDYASVQESDEVDIAQIEFNLSLAVPQRIDQYFRKMELREEIRKMRSELYGIEIAEPETIDPESDHLPAW